YWLADLCEDEAIPFTLGHALYMKAIHGGKAKNDKIDAGKIAGLLRGGMFTMAFVYPRDMRETRDLLRRRTFFVRQMAQLLAHIQNTNSQYNLPSMERQRARWPDYSDLAERFAHARVGPQRRGVFESKRFLLRSSRPTRASPGRQRVEDRNPEVDQT